MRRTGKDFFNIHPKKSRRCGSLSQRRQPLPKTSVQFCLHQMPLPESRPEDFCLGLCLLLAQSLLSQTILPPADRAVQILSQLFPTPADPAAVTGGIADRQRMVGEISGHYRPRRNHRPTSDRTSTQHRCICTDGCTPPDPRWPVRFLFLRVFTAGGQVIGEDTGRATEYAVLQFHPLVNRNIVLNLDIISNFDPRCKVHVLPQNAVFPHHRTNLQMAKELGYKTFFWSLAYVDWYDDDQPSKEEAFDKLLGRIHPGAVVLLHSTSDTNAEILDELIGEWEKMGYQIRPLEELTE